MSSEFQYSNPQYLDDNGNQDGYTFKNTKSKVRVLYISISPFLMSLDILDKDKSYIVNPVSYVEGGELTRIYLRTMRSCLNCGI